MSKQSLGRVSLVPKGAYNALTAYERLDVVTHDGASYIVLRPVQGVTPVDGENYMLLVQDGDTPDLSVGSVTTLEAGSKATASIGGTADKPELNFGIPKGDPGAAPALKMGKVTTLEPGSEASASLSGTPEEPELNLSIPRGASGGVDVANAEVGQTIIVKAVDEHGKPTEWEAADVASGGGEFVKLVDFTSEEDANTISMSTCDDGESLADKKITELFAHCEVAANAEATTLQKVIVKLGQLHVAYGAMTLPNCIYTTVRKFDVYMKATGGAIILLGKHSVDKFVDSSVNDDFYNYNSDRVVNNIERFEFYNMDYVLPAGTRVEIWGR